jgi:DeoR family transcriptional regulator, suf operon transcriptional repressor
MEVVENEPTREKIISMLKKKGKMTVSELADHFGITHIAIRHHLNALQKSNLVEGHEERHGIGRPHTVYQLTIAALERNSSNYFTFTNMLLKQLKQQLPTEMVERLFADIASQMAGDLAGQLEGFPLDQRLERLVAVMEKEGYMARIDTIGPNQYRLTELTCPYRKISLQHPEICLLDESLFSRVLGANVEKKSCIRTGSEECTFSICGEPQEAK